MPTSLYCSDTLNLACLFVGILCDSEEWKTYQFCLSNSSSTTSDKKNNVKPGQTLLFRSEFGQKGNAQFKTVLNLKKCLESNIGQFRQSFTTVEAQLSSDVQNAPWKSVRITSRKTVFLCDATS